LQSNQRILTALSIIVPGLNAAGSRNALPRGAFDCVGPVRLLLAYRLALAFL
jgi:hypothetical protein